MALPLSDGRVWLCPGQEEMFGYVLVRRESLALLWSGGRVYVLDMRKSGYALVLCLAILWPRECSWLCSGKEEEFGFALVRKKSLCSSHEEEWLCSGPLAILWPRE